MKKLTWINEDTGLRAIFGGGDYTVTVWDDMEGGYDFVFCRIGTSIAHERNNVSAELLEEEMREYQPDLRKWQKVYYE